MPDDVVITPKPDLTENDVLAKLNELDTDEPIKEEKDLDIPDIKEDEKKDKKEPKEKKSEEDEEEKLDEDEDDDKDELEDLERLDEDEDELKLLLPARRKDILKTYPDLFKKFPALERAMYREQGYTEVFPTIKEAKEAVENLREFKEIESSILDGDIESLLKTVKERDSEALNKIADEYLSSLYKVDQNAFQHVLNNLYKQTVKTMVQTAKDSNDDQLMAAAELFHKYLFGNATFSEPNRLAKAKTEKDSEIERERNEYLQERFVDARNELVVRVDNRLKSVISSAIDPKDEMSDYVKSKAIGDCVEQLHKQIGSDTRTQTILRNLWAKSKDTKFSKDSVNKIGSAYLSVAKSLLLPIIRENRTKALSGAKRLVVNKDDKTKERFKGSNDEKGERTSPKKMKPGESIEDFMMRD